MPGIFSVVWLMADGFGPQAKNLQPGLCRVLMIEVTRKCPDLLHNCLDCWSTMIRNFVDLLQQADREQMAPLIQGLQETDESSLPWLQAALSNQTPVAQPTQKYPNQRLPYVERDRRRQKSRVHYWP